MSEPGRDDERLQDLIRAELGDDTIELTVARGRVVAASRDLVGLALSGGGIRSATFNLGLLQGLERIGLLERLDYLSTVSGGGYVGGFWTAWRARQAASDGPATFPVRSDGGSGAEHPVIRHLREFSNFLAPHLGLLSWDTGRMVVTLASSLVPSLLAAFSLIALVILAWCLVAYGLFHDAAIRSVLTLVVFSTALLGVMELFWQARGEESDPLGYWLAWLIGVGVATASWWALIEADGALLTWDGARLPIVADDRPWQQGFHLWAPALSWIAASVALSLIRWFFSRSIDRHRDRVRQNSFDRVHARFLFAAGAWTVISALWWIGTLVWGLAEQGWASAAGLTTGLGGATAAVVLLFSRIQKRFSAGSKSTLGAGVMAAVRLLLPRVLAYLAVVLMVIGTVAAIVAFDRSGLTNDSPWLVAIVAVVILVLVALLFDPNQIGLHTFYRGRIARAYLGASNELARGKTEEHQQDDIALGEIRVRGPCHLICCAANDLATAELGNLRRGAQSAVLSPAGCSIGSMARRWQPGEKTPTLSEAITASAAAFNPLMGSKSIELGPSVPFLMAAFNLRLGLWLPRDCAVLSRDRWLVGLPFFKEMFGQSSVTHRHVHLSDGGHFENLGVYELIRRHCRFIIAADCGMDPSVSFDDFGNLVRSVRIDFGVDIRIDLSALQPDERGCARQPMVAGDVHYPEGDVGVLLLFKPTITGDEPPDVAQYRTRNTAFPHESTVDQFYDQAQWEAYRRLGEHAVTSAFQRIRAGLDPQAGDYARRIFLRARREWQGIPEGFAERLSRFADRIEQLDARLREPEAAGLLREVYPELPGVDAATDDGADGGASAPPELPPLDQLTRALHLARHVLLLLQETYLRENLESRADHPLYRGLMNYFGRWLAAPQIRLWWPLLEALYPRSFTRFVERHYRLSGGAPRSRVVLMERSMERLPGGGAVDRLTLEFRLELRYRGREHWVGVGELHALEWNRTLVWSADDFVVRPGFWGVGIGERFLRALSEGAYPAQAQSDQASPSARWERLLVRIPDRPSATESERLRTANEAQLYRRAGFESADPGTIPVALGRLPVHVDEPAAWMIR